MRAYTMWSSRRVEIRRASSRDKPRAPRQRVSGEGEPAHAVEESSRVGARFSGRRARARVVIAKS